jgi:hypothetical protein
MGINFKKPLAVLFFLLFIQSSVSSQWFWSNNYYAIRAKGFGLVYSKGKPTIEGPFTVFIKWPENLEWRVKTEDVRSIKDIGPLSPDEIKEKNLKIEKELLENIISRITLGGGFYSSEQLMLARSSGLSDKEIWDFWINKNPALSEAKAGGFSLEVIAKEFDE